MNKADVGPGNIYFKIDSRKRTEARIYEEVTGERKTPATKREGIEMSAQESRKKRQPAKEMDRVAFRPMLLVAATVATVAFLTAVASLVLALTMMLSQNSTTPSKDSTDVCGE